MKYISIFLVCVMAIGQSVRAQITFHSQMDVTIDAATGWQKVTNCAFTPTAIWVDPIWSTYSWSTGATTDSITLTPSAPSTAADTIYLMVTNMFGAPTFDTLIVTSDLYSNQNAFWIDFGFDPTICQDDPMILGGCQCGTAFYPDSIFYSDGTTCLDIGVIVVPGACRMFPPTSSPGLNTAYYTRYRPSNGCRYRSMNVNFNVVAKPAAPSVVQVDSSLVASPGSVFTWYDNTMTPIPGATGSIFEPGASGNYYCSTYNTTPFGDTCEGPLAGPIPYLHPMIPFTPMITPSGPGLMASSGPHHIWYDGSVSMIPGAGDTFYVPTVTGYYYAKAYDLFFGDTLFSALSDPYFFELVAASGTASQVITLYPNPSRYEVSLTGLLPEDRILISDFTGRIMMDEVAEREGSVRYSVASMPAGMYLLRVKRGNEEIYHLLSVIHE